MAELLEIWKYSRENEDVFTRCARRALSPGREGWHVRRSDRARNLVEAAIRTSASSSQVKEHGISILGETGGTQLAQMMRFHLHAVRHLECDCRKGPTSNLGTTYSIWLRRNSR